MVLNIGTKEDILMLGKNSLAAGLIIASTSAFAGVISPPPTTTSTSVVDPSASLFLGLTWTLGGNDMSAGKPGLTLKLLSTNERDKAAAIAGVTLNFDGTVGCDLGLAYNDDDVTVGASYDICQRGPQVSLGGTSKPDVITTTTPIPD